MSEGPVWLLIEWERDVCARWGKVALKFSSSSSFGFCELVLHGGQLGTTAWAGNARGAHRTGGRRCERGRAAHTDFETSLGSSQHQRWVSWSIERVEVGGRGGSKVT